MSSDVIFFYDYIIFFIYLFTVTARDIGNAVPAILFFKLSLATLWLEHETKPFFGFII